MIVQPFSGPQGLPYRHNFRHFLNKYVMHWSICPGTPQLKVRCCVLLKCCSRLTNLLELLDISTDSFDQGKQVDVSYLDFSNVFDKVPHKRLIFQLTYDSWNSRANSELDRSVAFGTSGRLNGTKSDWKVVTSGVLQVSVLGPLLFIIFVNQIECSLEYGSQIRR